MAYCCCWMQYLQPFPDDSVHIRPCLQQQLDSRHLVVLSCKGEGCVPLLAISVLLLQVKNDDRRLQALPHGP